MSNLEPLTKKVIELRKERADLEQEIKSLTKQKADADFMVSHEREMTALKIAKQQAEARYKKALKELSQVIYEKSLVLEVDEHKPKKGYNIKPISSNIKSESIANVVWSDWHSEQKVKSEEVAGKNEFNPDICADRVTQLVRTTLEYVNIERSRTSITELVIAILGDLMSGYIHEDLMSSNYKTPTEAILSLFELIVSAINFLLDNGEFERITVVCKPGNHSRITRKIEHQSGMEKTLEWLLYHFLAKHFKNEERLEFIIPESYTHIINQYGYPIRYSHGTAFKYNKGIGGASVPIYRTLHRWNATEQAYLDVFGHLHTYDTPRKYICNGALIGYTPLALDEGYEYEPPIQAFFLIEKKRGLTVNRPIYLG